MTNYAQLSMEQASALLLARQESQSSLIRFAQHVPIAGVPIGDNDDVYSTVETPLAVHHRLILECLQAMADRDLTYVLDSVGVPSFALPCPAAKTPHGGSFDGGVAFDNKYPHLSKFLKKQPFPYSSKDTKCDAFQDIIKNGITKNEKSTKILGDIPSENPISITSGDSLPQVIENELINICLRVMLMLPPGSAKSTYASVVFPSWDMGRNPHNEIILTGYGDVICKRHGKRARQMCNHDAYQNIFGCSLDPNTRAADEWELTNGSSYKASGILSGITGFRADGLIWDDLTKGRKEADSVTIRNDTYNAYIDDARSRKKPRAWEVGIGTRWHEDEIMGRILPEGYAGESGFMECRDGNIWMVICIPAQAEREDDPLGREIGEFIWPEWFGEGFWKDKKIIPRSWASLYQQRPSPDEGLYFKKEWFRYYTDLPEELNYYIGFDPAVTSEEDNAEADETCIQLWGIDSQLRLYLVDEWVRQVTMDIWIAQILDWVSIYKPLECISESGVIRRASEPYLKREMRKRGVFALFEWMGRNSNKSAMARPLQAMLASGQVYLPKNSVGENTEDEFLRFPAAKKDHRVDAAANLCLRLEKVWEANPPEVVVEEVSVLQGGGIPIKSLMPARFPKKRSRWNLSKRHSQ